MTDLARLKASVCDQIDASATELLEVSRAIHANPELSFQEFEAARMLTDKVEAAGLTVQRGAYGLETAYATEFGNTGPTVAILSEYDALPDIGHSCGHNIIAVAGLGASLALSALGEKLAGHIRYIGTPAEEKGGGKELMAQEGAFAGIDAAVMVHPGGLNLVSMPSICVSEVEATYHGKSAHASAMPHVGLNALDGLVSAYQAIAQLRQHIKSTERVHGIFTEAGVAPNIVPDRATGLFYVRAANARDQAPLKKRVEDCFDAGALSSGCSVDVTWSRADYLDMNTNWPLARAFQANAESLGRTFFPYEKLPPGSAGSTDMGNVSHRVPAIHPMIASAPQGVVIHNREFEKWAGSEMGDRACIDGAKSLAMTVLDYFASEDLRDEIAGSYAKTKMDSDAAIAAAYRPDSEAGP